MPSLRNGEPQIGGIKNTWEYGPFQESLYVYFTGVGVWKFDGTTWPQATPNNPVMMVEGN